MEPAALAAIISVPAGLIAAAITYPVGGGAHHRPTGRPDAGPVHRRCHAEILTNRLHEMDADRYGQIFSDDVNRLMP
ncbi:hypothetical protein ACWGH2_36870 [Streptomyces sp. NPDC054871]